MRKLYMLMVLLMAAVVPMVAQSQGTSKKSRAEMRKEVQEFKLKFLAQEMELKEDQQARFFEVYNQMTEEKGKVLKETRALEKKLGSTSSDADYAAVSKAITEAKEKDAAIDKKYDKIFSSFLTSKQMFKMKAAEEKFRDKIHEMRHKRSLGKKKK